MLYVLFCDLFPNHVIFPRFIHVDACGIAQLQEASPHYILCDWHSLELCSVMLLNLSLPTCPRNSNVLVLDKQNIQKISFLISGSFTVLFYLLN